MTYPQSYFDTLTKVIEYNNQTYFWIVIAFIFFTLLAIFFPKEKMMNLSLQNTTFFANNFHSYFGIDGQE